jgi:NAD(P) transhydrogenase subunit alpha
MKNVFLCGETTPEETRAALVPADVKRLSKIGYRFAVQRGAGSKAGYEDGEYAAAGAEIVGTAADGYAFAEIVARVNRPSGPEGIRPGTLHLSSFDAFSGRGDLKAFADAGVRLVSLEMVPRSTIAQKMDIQSSQASLAGYYAVILAASRLPKIMPMMTTPSGNIRPARVFVIGVGVAGLQAIATAKRLGARVEAFDTRPVVEEQVKSLGARFVKIDLGETGQTDQGYARELTAEQVELQRKAQAKVCAQSDVVITTAKVFGRRAPVLLTRETVAQMKSGSIVIDMAVKTGGNVEGSDPERDVVLDNGVAIIGGDSLERFVPRDASDMFSGNVSAFLEHFWDAKACAFAPADGDDIMRSCLMTSDGRIVHEKFI